MYVRGLDEKYSGKAVWVGRVSSSSDLLGGDVRKFKKR